MVPVDIRWFRHLLCIRFSWPACLALISVYHYSALDSLDLIAFHLSTSGGLDNYSALDSLDLPALGLGVLNPGALKVRPDSEPLGQVSSCQDPGLWFFKMH